MRKHWCMLALLSLIAQSACSKKESPGAADAASDPVAHGKKIYAANCTACHNPDPLKEGSLGPVVAGSSLEVLERRIVHGDYPEGYVPKRKSKVMVALPHLKGEIESLHKYLSSLTPPK